MSDYKILREHSIEALENEVNILRISEPEWRCVGGPFLEPYATGHGPIFAGPPDFNLWIFINFCQALERDHPKSP